VAIVPFIALVFAITKGFGYAKELEIMILENFSSQEEVVQWLLIFANNLLDTSKSGLFGAIGFITFLWSVIWLMISVEQAFNNVWQVKNDNFFVRRIIIYMGIILLSPIILGGSLMIPLSYNAFIPSIGFDFKFVSSLEPVVSWLMLSTFLCIIVFAAYKFIPNIKVRNTPAFRAAIFTTIVFMGIQALYLETQLLVSRLNAIYGAFAAIPFFMLWMNINWFLLLIGAELTYAFQHVDSYKPNTHGTATPV
jgi:membrane protein